MEKIILKNGLTVVLISQPGARSAAINFFVAGGNRFEPAEKSGVSHFIEHMVFKGTTSRSADDIARESDLMGGRLNAYTAKEYTCFYSHVLKEHVARALHLMCDMLCNPLFDPCEMETEKGVIMEEIGMYEESPEDLCSDMLTALCYKDSPMGFNITGTRESVRAMTPDDLREYMGKIYVPERMVASVCGGFDKSLVLEILDRYFGGRKNTGNPIRYDTMKISGGITLCGRESSQTQLAFCFNGLPAAHRLRYPYAFFTSIAGGATSSRINLRIREELGLAYSAYSFSSGYLGTGIFGISAGLAPENQEKFLREVFAILKEIRTGVTDAEMELTKEQYKASLVLSNESISSIAAAAGRQVLFEGEYTDIDGLIRAVENVTAEEVAEAARLATDFSTVALSAVGAVESEDFYRRILETIQ